MKEEEIEEDENEETDEVEIWEFGLDEEEIDELINKLKNLKETKTNFSFDIDENNELLIHHEEEEE